jgi:hypothetical protein
LLSIAQSGNKFHYINWIPTINGPVIDGYGVKSYEQTNLSSTQFYKSLFTDLVEQYKIEIPIIHLSLDMDSIHLSESFLPDNTHIENYNSWIDSITFDSDFSNRFDSFNYPFDGNQFKCLNIHLPVQIKRSIINAVKQSHYEIRFLSLGIFSAETLAEILYKSNNLKSFLIWRIGKFNFNEILYIKGGNLVCYLRFKRIKGVCKLQNYFGNTQATDKIFKQLEKCSESNLEKLKISDKVFIYSNIENSSELNNIISKNNPKIEHLNIANKIKFDSKSPSKTPFIFAETGLGFRGFDV